MKDLYSHPPPSLPAGSSIWAYSRDSGGTFQDRSVTQQESEIINYCKQHSLTPTKVFRDIAC